MSSVLRSVAQPKSKYFIGVGDSVTTYAFSDEDAPTTPTATTSVSLAAGNIYTDMGKTIQFGSETYIKVGTAIGNVSTAAVFWIKLTNGYLPNTGLVGLARI
jgi:uncharacterized membrane protein